MRAIKFRAFKLGIKEFVYGLLSTYKYGYFNIEGFAVEKETIGQFTGLLDFEGNEIYEGDIVRLKSNIGKIENSNNYEIRWSDDECSFVLHDEESEHYESKTLIRKLIRDKELKVIGNIYENK